MRRLGKWFLRHRMALAIIFFLGLNHLIDWGPFNLLVTVYAQATQVTGQVLDSSGIPYAGATMKAGLVFAGAPVSNPTVTINVLSQCRANGFGSAPCQVPFTPSNGPFNLDSVGNIPSGGITLQDNSLVTPAGTQWAFTVNSAGNPPPLGTGPQTCSATLTISGASQVISSSFAACPKLSNAGASGSSGSANQIDPTQAPFNVKVDASKTGGDGTSTNGTPTFSSTNQICNPTTDVGKLMIVVNVTTGAYPYGLGLITVLGCSGNNWTLSGNANASAGAAQNWAIGSAGNGAALQSAFTAALTAGKILALPCGTLIVDSPPFLVPVSLAYFNQRPDIQGCNATTGTVFIFHPALVAAVVNSGGDIFSNITSTSTTGAIFYNGITGSSKIENIVITSLSGALPCNLVTYNIIHQTGVVSNIMIQGLSAANGCTIVGVAGNGESRLDRLNFQNSVATGAAYSWVIFSGQGQNAVTNSVFAFTAGYAVTCNVNTTCDISGNYFTAVQGAVNVGGGGSGVFLTFSKNVCSANGNGSVHGCVTDTGTGNTISMYSNTVFAQAANTCPVTVNTGSVVDMSVTSDAATTSGFSLCGTGAFNDRAGNTFSGPLTQFTGKYVPIGGGSVANNTASANTNFGANLGATNVLTSVSPAAATYDVKIGFRQTTLGVGCGAGSNTVNGVLSWTSGGVTQSTGSGGVPALGTLTIAANGVVGTSSSYTSQPVHIDINTQVTFTTTSVLASAGCGTIPQYVVDFSNI